MSALGSESFTLIFVTTGWSQKVVVMASVKTGEGYETAV